MYVRKMLMISFTKCSVCFVYLYEVFLGDAFGPLYTHLCSPTWITDVRTLYQHALYQRAVFRGGQLVYNCHTVRWASPTLMKKYIISISSLSERERGRESIYLFLNYHWRSFLKFQCAFVDTADKLVEVFKVLLHLCSQHHVNNGLPQGSVLIPC